MTTKWIKERRERLLRKTEKWKHVWPHWGLRADSSVSRKALRQELSCLVTTKAEATAESGSRAPRWPADRKTCNFNLPTSVVRGTDIPGHNPSLREQISSFKAKDRSRMAGRVWKCLIRRLQIINSVTTPIFYKSGSQGGVILPPLPLQGISGNFWRRLWLSHLRGCYCHLRPRMLLNMP